MTAKQYQPGSAFNEMKEHLQRGVLVTGAASSHAVFTSAADAGRFATAVSHGGINKGRVLQVTDAADSRKPLLFSSGIEIEKGKLPMPVPRGQSSLFCVPVSISREECNSLLPDMLAEGKVLDNSKASMRKCLNELTVARTVCV